MLISRFWNLWLPSCFFPLICIKLKIFCIKFKFDALTTCQSHNPLLRPVTQLPLRMSWKCPLISRTVIPCLFLLYPLYLHYFFFFKRMLGFLNHNILKCYQMLYAFQFKFSSEHTVIFHFCGGPVCMCSWLFLPSLLQSGRQRKKAVMMPRVVLTPLKVNGEHVPSGYNSSFSCSLFSPPSPFLYFPPTLQWFVYLLPLTMDALYLSGLTVFVILHIDTL